MRRIFFSGLLLLAAAASAQNSFIELAGETRLALPDGWRVVGSAEDYPFAIVHDESEAQLLLFRTEMYGIDRITGPADFESAVQEVVDSVVLTLPDADIQTSTGYYETGRARFVIEFQSEDTTFDRPFRHRLSGFIYRHGDGHQLLFSLWGRAPADRYNTIRGDLIAIGDSFRYTGPQAEGVFVSATDSRRWLIVMLVGLAAIFFFLRYRRHQLQRQQAPPVRTWRCTCGRTNHIDNEVCRSCGRSRDQAT